MRWCFVVFHNVPNVLACWQCSEVLAVFGFVSGSTCNAWEDAAVLEAISLLLFRLVDRGSSTVAIGRLISQHLLASLSWFLGLCVLIGVCGCSYFAAGAMSEDTLRALLEERTELSSQWLQVGRRLKEARRQQQQQEAKSRDRGWQLTCRQERVVLILYGLAGYTAGPAVQYLAMQAGKRKWPSRSPQDLDSLVGDLFLQVDVRQFAALLDEQGPSDVEAFRVAVAFLREWEVAEWVRGINQRQGVAPATETVLEEFEKRRMQYPDELRPRELGSITESRARESARQWRLRWGARHARVRVCGDGLGPAELREKARSFFCTSLCMTAGCHFGSRFWVGFWGPLVAIMLIFIGASLLGSLCVPAGGSGERSALWMCFGCAGGRCMAMVQSFG